MHPRIEFATLDGIVTKGNKAITVAIKALKIAIRELVGPENAIGIAIKLLAELVPATQGGHRDFRSIPRLKQSL
jgi:hypothetical protein